MTDLLDPPLCGDTTCQGPGCRQSSIDAWYERQQAEARAFVRSVLGLPPEVPDAPPSP